MSFDHPRGGVRKRAASHTVTPEGLESLISATEDLALSRAAQSGEQDSAGAGPSRPQSTRAASTPYIIVRQHSRSAAHKPRSQPQSQPSSESSVACSPTTPSSGAQRRLHALRRRMATASASRAAPTTMRSRSASLVQHRRSEQVGRFHVTYGRESSPEPAYQGEAASSQSADNPFARHSAPQAGDGETLRGGVAVGTGKALGMSRSTSEPPRDQGNDRPRGGTPDMDFAFGEVDDIEEMDLAPSPDSRPVAESSWGPGRRPRTRDGSRRQQGAGVGLEPGYLGDREVGDRQRRTVPSAEPLSRDPKPCSAIEAQGPPTPRLARMPRQNARLEGIKGMVGREYSPSEASDPLKRMQQARDRRKQ